MFTYTVLFTQAGVHDREPSGVQDSAAPGVHNGGEGVHGAGAGAGVCGQGGGGVRACTAAKVHHRP